VKTETDRGRCSRLCYTDDFALLCLVYKRSRRKKKDFFFWNLPFCTWEWVVWLGFKTNSPTSPTGLFPLL